ARVGAARPGSAASSSSDRAGQPGRSVAPDPSGGASRSPGASPGAGGPGVDGGPGPAGAVASGSRSPMALASVGTYTGPAGTILVGFSQGAQLWVKYVNAKGGLA